MKTNLLYVFFFFSMFDSVVASALSDPAIMGWDRELNLDIEFCVDMDICREKKLSRMTDKLSENLLAGVVTVSGGVTAPMVGSKVGQKFFCMLPGDVLLASLDSFSTTISLPIP
jgi:hypothetical protein